MDSIVAVTINDSSFVYTEVATGGANHRGKVKRLEDVEPHGVDFYTSVYDHPGDFANYVNEHGTCKGYKGAVKPRGVHLDIDRPDVADALNDTRELGNRLVREYDAPPKWSVSTSAGPKVSTSKSRQSVSAASKPQRAPPRR